MNERRNIAAGMAWVRRYRPYIVLVVAVSLAVTLPHVVGSGPSRALAGVRGGTSVEAAGQASRGVPDGSGGGALAGSGQAATAAGPSGPSTGSGTAALGTPALANDGPGATSGTYPGIGTAAALAGPHCDPATGRVKIPSLFAPECVVPWPAGADNGGSTYQGVTKDRISIVLYENPTPSAPETHSTAAIEQQAIDTIDMFANHYELWGRKLDIHFVKWSCGGGQVAPSEQCQRADAVQAFNQYHPFIASSYLNIGGTPLRTWATEMAARGVISWDPDANYAESHGQPGLRYSYDPDDRMSALELGEYVGKRLWGRTAVHAGDSSFTATKRVLGLVYDQNWDAATFKDTLARYGASVVDAVSFDPSADPASMQLQANTEISRLKSKHVTTIIDVAGSVYNVLLTKAATSQAFFPEWVVSGWNLQDTAILSRLNDQQQWRHAFGVGLVPPLELPVAISERSELFQWTYGRPPADDIVNGQIYLFAKDAIAGIQLAGPILNPTTYRAALFTSAPKGGRWCSCVTHTGVSFGRHIGQYPGDKYFDADDFVEKWWDPTAIGQDEVGLEGSGEYRIVAGGKRFLPGDWPTTDPDVFNPATSVVSYSSEPSNDRLPTYPRW